MSKTELILELTSKKDKRVTMQFNRKLWEMVVEELQKEGIKPTQFFEKCMLKYLEEKGRL